MPYKKDYSRKVAPATARGGLIPFINPPSSGGGKISTSATFISLVTFPFLLCFFLHTNLMAKTWTVELDSSGDFTVIQDAINAAASGDTIRIGPGQFDDKFLLTSPGWSDSVIANVSQDTLTLIGSGASTIVGQNSSWDSSQGQTKGIVASDYWGNSHINISNISFKNFRDAIYTSHENTLQSHVSVKHCSFYKNLYSASIIGGGGTANFDGNVFEYMPGSGVHVISWNMSEMTFFDNTFSFASHIQTSGKSLSLNNSGSVSIGQSRFQFGSIGIGASLGSQIHISNCTFQGQTNVAISPQVGSTFHVSDCSFTNQTRVLTSISLDNHVSMSNSIINGVSDCAILMSYAGTVSINNCDLDGGPRGVIYIQSVPNCTQVETLDMTGNYWGTTVPDSISSLIWDHADTSSACYIVDFDPYLPISTPTNKSTWGSFKSMFR